MIPREFQLDGKVAIVTESGNSRGRSIALAMAEAGADIASVARDPKAAEETARQVRQLRRNAAAITADARRLQDVERMAMEVISGLGRIDILVNNAEVEFAKPLIEVTEDEWRQVMDMNLTATFFCCRAVGKYMLAQKSGKIINIASGLGEKALPNSAAYCASKGAVIQFTKALALEWARENINVNAICPAWFSKATSSAEEAAKDAVVKFIPMKRLGQPQDLCALVVYLASGGSNFIVGQSVFVDGGVMSHG